MHGHLLAVLPAASSAYMKYASSVLGPHLRGSGHASSPSLRGCSIPASSLPRFVAVDAEILVDRVGMRLAPTPASMHRVAICLTLCGCYSLETVPPPPPLHGDGMPTDPIIDGYVAIPCPAYPSDGLGWREGDVATDWSLPGNGPGDEWALHDFWCMATGEGATVAVLVVHSMTDGISMGQVGPELEEWQDTYASRGLVVVGVTILVSFETARAYWEETLGHTHPWMADEAFTVGRFFPGPMLGTPAYVVLDLSTMEIAHVQEGFNNEEEQLFEPYLR
jgi:hypothetical protein